MEQTRYQDRIKQVQGIMRERGIDLFALGPSANLRYLAGYPNPADERLALLLIPAEAPPFGVFNRLYRESAERMGLPDLIFWDDGNNPFVPLANEIRRRSLTVGTFALENELPVRFSLPLLSLFPQARFVSGDCLTSPLRAVKDDFELECIRRGSRAADQALGELINRGRYWIGKTEEDFIAELARTLKDARVVNLQGIAAVGANASDPHHLTGDTVIEDGKCLMVDFWGTYEGYYTDCTRTFHFGDPPAEFEKIHQIVLEAHLAAERAALPGRALGDVDAAARERITQAGYGEYFTHRTGHGLGIEDHEGAAAAPGEKTPIEPGMVFSIEPGIYIPGRFGVRIENLLAMGKTGPEILHHYPRELQIIRD